MIHGHGDDLYRLNQPVRVNFSTNIPDVRHDGLERHLASSFGLIAHYPDPDASRLTAKISACGGVRPDNVLVTAGAVDAIYSVAQLYEGCRSAILAPTFSEYADAACAYGHECIYLTSLSGIPDADVVWICNPNNPTGHFIAASELLALADSRPDTLLVIDQAYEDYVVGDKIADCDAAARSNLVLLHSMTKRFQIPGLRIGYLAASSALIGRLRRFRMPWAVNAMAIEALDYALGHADEFLIDTAGLVTEQRRVSQALRSMGVKVEESQTNFLLGRLPHGSAAGLKRWLLERHAMLIRDASNFHGLTDMHFRVAVQSETDDDELIDAIDEWLQMHC